MKQDDFKVIDNIPQGIIETSPVHGRGLFAREKLDKGTALCQLDGQIVSWDLYDEVLGSLKEESGILADYLMVEWNALSETTLLIRPFRTKYSFINHSRTPNLKILHDPIRIVTVSAIPKGAELFLDYRQEPLRKEYLENHGKTYL